MFFLKNNSTSSCCIAVIAAYCFAAMTHAASDSPTLFEAISEDEAASIKETAELTTKLQDKRALKDPSQEGLILRGVHAKSHGCVSAEFTVLDSLEEKYQVGLFSNPGKTHRASIRFSNAAVLREDDLKTNKKGDRENGSRGMAIKIHGVDGENLSNGDDQDFLMINTPTFAFANVRDYLRLNRILALSPKGNEAEPFFLPLALAKLGAPQVGESPKITAQRESLEKKKKSIAAFDDFDNKKDLAGTSASLNAIEGDNGAKSKVVRNPLQVSYFGAAPFLFGADRAMRFAAVPCQAVEQEAFINVTADVPGRNYLRDALTSSLTGSDEICFQFKIAVRTADSADLNIEDATAAWADESGTYFQAATITISTPQSPQTPQALADCEALAFSPWHALSVHRPIGGINRLRQKVYSASAKHRRALGY